jgi:hypothetical protein
MALARPPTGGGPRTRAASRRVSFTARADSHGQTGHTMKASGKMDARRCVNVISQARRSTRNIWRTLSLNAASTAQGQGYKLWPDKESYSGEWSRGAFGCRCLCLCLSVCVCVCVCACARAWALLFCNSAFCSLDHMPCSVAFPPRFCTRPHDCPGGCLVPLTHMRAR